ncbi:MAG TPA: hypothetical protein VFB58_07295 [Chloroflexota bacterium]|nr:hypothetical protein [Chloroflexota bacterium]
MDDDLTDAWWDDLDELWREPDEVLYPENELWAEEREDREIEDMLWAWLVYRANQLRAESGR